MFGRINGCLDGIGAWMDGWRIRILIPKTISTHGTNQDVVF